MIKTLRYICVYSLNSSETFLSILLKNRFCMFMCPCTCLNTSIPTVLYLLQLIYHLVEPIHTIKIFFTKILECWYVLYCHGYNTGLWETVLKPGENVLNFLFCLNITNYFLSCPNITRPNIVIIYWACVIYMWKNILLFPLCILPPCKKFMHPCLFPYGMRIFQFFLWEECTSPPH